MDRDILFGPFRLQRSQQRLLAAGSPVHLGARAFDVLVALVECAGGLVSKEELMARVWPNVTVDESNLRTQMALLRKALHEGHAGARYVATIPGRGYRFVASVSFAGDEPRAARTPPPALLRQLPARLTRLVGRAGAVNDITAGLRRRRFITIVGPGGIGKTSVAQAVAEKASALYDDGVYFVDLAPLADPMLVTGTVASALDLAIASEDQTTGIVAHLRNRSVLIVLDTCERIVEAAAILAETLLKGASRIHILATSREPLRAEGEGIYRLPPLETPPASVELAAAEAVTFSAVELFVDRIGLGVDGSELSDDDAPAVADICRRLDGIALAIELAAARVDSFGIRGVEARLDDRFRLLNLGRRTALTRHRTLEATLDWSYEFLPETERTVLQRLAVFAGTFKFEAACSVAVDGAITAPSVIDIVTSLVSKSLVAADVKDETESYRLLDTTRAYAFRKLAESGELTRIQQCHAEYFRDMLERIEVAAAAPTADWLAARASSIGDVRQALTWAFSPGGDTEIGVALTVAALPLWTRLSLNGECRKHVERALAFSNVREARNMRRNMQLFAALGATLIYTKGPGPESSAAWTSVLEIAEKLTDTDYQLRALWGLWSDRFNSGAYRAALEITEKVRQVAARSPDEADLLISDRMAGTTLFHMGDHTNGRRHIEIVLNRFAVLNRSHIVRYQFDQRIVARTVLARILWGQGYPDQARRMVDSLIDDAGAADHATSLSLALAQAGCPVALLVGDLTAAERFVNMLDRLTRETADLWNAWCVSFKGMLLIACNSVRAGLNVLHEALDGLPQEAFHMRYTGVYAVLAEAHGCVGEFSQGLTIIDDAIVRCEQYEIGWCLAELLRIKGDLLRLTGKPTAAEAQFQRSLNLARRQEVLSWELRTAINLARLRRQQGRIAEAYGVLAPVFGRFTEGFGTADLRTAKGLLDELS